MMKTISEYYSFRFLILMFIIRDLKLRYKQTFLGLFWVVLQPMLPLMIFTCVFGRMVKMDSQGIPYMLFAFSGLVPWLLFSESVSRCSNVLVLEERLLTKVYFPKLILPFSKFTTVFIDFLISLLLFFIFLFFYKIPLSSRLAFFPVVLAVLILLTLSLGILISALTVYFRDFRIVTPFLLQIGMYASPIIYSARIVPERFQIWFFLNPMVGIIESFRWIFFKNIVEFPMKSFIFSVVFSIIVFYISVCFFKKVEKYFADVI